MVFWFGRLARLKLTPVTRCFTLCLMDSADQLSTSRNEDTSRGKKGAPDLREGWP